MKIILALLVVVLAGRCTAFVLIIVVTAYSVEFESNNLALHMETENGSPKYKFHSKDKNYGEEEYELLFNSMYECDLSNSSQVWYCTASVTGRYLARVLTSVILHGYSAAIQSRQVASCSVLLVLVWQDCMF